MKRIALIFTLLSSIIIYNCSQTRSDIGYMHKLNKNICSIYNTGNIKINVAKNNGTEILKISIEDPKYNDYSSKRKQNMAIEIGKLAIDNRENMPLITLGELTFINNSNYGIAQTNKSDSYKMY